MSFHCFLAVQESVHTFIKVTRIALKLCDLPKLEGAFVPSVAATVVNTWRTPFPVSPLDGTLLESVLRS